MLLGVTLLYPELILIITALGTLLIARRIRGTRIGLGLTVTAGIAAAISAASGLSAETTTGFSGMIVQDAFSQFFEVLIAAALVLSALLSYRSEPDEERTPPEYYALLLLATTGMLMAVSAVDLMTLYLGLELTTICSYVLVGLRVERPAANEAAIKYFLMGSFASALLLFGISLIYGLTGTTELAAIAVALEGADANPLLLVGLALLSAGLAFKISAVPFHSWAPDAYQGADSPVAAFMAAGPKAAGLAVMARVGLVAFQHQSEFMGLILVSIAALSIVVGSLLSLSQTDMRRLLAYSAIAHAGYALMGLAAGSPEGAAATMTYAFFYVFMTIGAFGVVVALGERGETIEGFRGLSTQRPGLAAITLLFLLALTGIPLTSGFTAKFGVILAAVRADQLPLALLAVSCSVISAFVYMRIAVLMYMSDPAEDSSSTVSPGVSPGTSPALVHLALGLAAAVTLVGGILPGILSEWMVFP
jgi:NADH-quinone oxidoreductase subunit N